jgi:hypothetical protein
MQQTVKNDIISVLEEAIAALRTGAFEELVAISNRTTHDIALYADEGSLGIALLVYAMSKIVMRSAEHEKTSPIFEPFLLKMLERLKQDDDEEIGRAHV